MSPVAVRAELKIARNETRQYLQSAARRRELGPLSSTGELLPHLRQTVFNSRKGDCVTAERLVEAYMVRVETASTFQSGAN
jgi:hypothetical protein